MLTLIRQAFILILLSPQLLQATLNIPAPDLRELTDDVATTAGVPARSASAAVCEDFNRLNSLIRDGKIHKDAAKRVLVTLLDRVRNEYYLRGGRDFQPSAWAFPLAGYDIRSIDTGRQHGFSASGYDFFSGNRHGGHPALDLFIHDRDQDSRDDQTGKPVAVLSMTGGVVVALEREWSSDSGLRGGKYLWIYDPANQLLVYYAHNQELLVDIGTIVKPGDLLARVGRSGLNAAKKRSPTHLHFSVLQLRNGLPIARNVYKELVDARVLEAR
ncbi:MAG TPA: M23 family metallopeptidase [Desulfuromonadales bacterium]|nr:M23 family metallopeptidase [Desulfuromonadales bacterium]